MRLVLRPRTDNDRQYRHPRIRSTKTGTRKDTAKVRRRLLDSGVQDSGSSPGEDCEPLPPLDEIIDAVDRFTRQSFQLGFIPKRQFIDRLRKSPQSVDLFLLLSILSVSARLTPALIGRFGSGIAAAEFFMERAATMAVGEIYQKPTLERCQAFYLLSISQQGNGLGNKSHINMGIAMRLATLLQLHREETYRIAQVNPEAVIRSESARRTLWLLYSQDSIHSGPFYPVSLAASDITALLPSDEADFAAGRLPGRRAALADTLPAIKSPSLLNDPDRSLFASFIQIHYFWGTVSRRAISYSRSSCPWDPGSHSAQMMDMLSNWEASLPIEHRWSAAMLQKHKSESQDLGYLSITMMTRLCNIVARRPYLAE
ncbi:Fungal specific transcription factor domain [Geosmithia morbida]|uniref:Fungal specific transcription factor domain n=1 Tax=Geosmithia morbida TaxID=1094350 RepID=A0A9P5D7F6_9HYPO|nr:Fungal specific transcription factor domain [Geosmithia morbida]KAF4124474.1 Fungal specific transcription factor domain [Geosmithia morbida]